MTLVLSACTAGSDQRWYRGNTHTHTLWSDGDAAPEDVADWYTSHGYDFLVLSDHNVLSVGDRWFPVSEGEGGRLTRAEVEDLQERFGADSVELREGEDGTEMRLLTLPELRERFEEPGRFLFIQGEEITDAFEGKPIHVNGLHLDELIPPQGGDSLQETIQRNVDAVIEQGRRLGRVTLAHLNHPNFGWAVTPEDLAAIEGERFFEVYNGHSAVRNHGDDDHPSTEEMWDIALTLRLEELGLGLLYGLATDDAHHYGAWGVGHNNPGRGWVMVRSPLLEAAAILEAMERGDFYATSGVRLTDVRRRGDRYIVDIEADEGVTYITRFIGTRRSGGRAGSTAAVLEIGEVLLETAADPAVYEITGDELYVRAVVVSSRSHPNPYAEGDRETAWVQPIVP
jgi:hypothetical protein